ncbi:sugar fermentation stimulation protein SfsA [Hydrococcus rivularis NIES-593]|uniref:Sugar fermentation stimulation protein homolog n=1 Tax=Hydrococcus rivularis NIES-593 TaxID=1921803 RepID=A0A1U7HJJ3_9CYAN|nr:DNA/RNA nuclease SfsA [Hydrococcus rivularis]OKH23763.1 sugar fermentation stimulation protein SfsA [Hydrococcus rivularis NIES-593]
MTTDLLYCYPPLISGILLRRYKRFFADIELTSGEIITAHCPNTGPMTGVCAPGSLVQVSLNNNPKRKLAYTWETILVNDTQPTWVGINTGLPNRIVRLALEKQLFPELGDRYRHIRWEVPYGKDKKSRVDFLLTNDESVSPIYMEVKNTTLAQNNVALFPDTVTTRGQKHLQELMALLPDAKPVMLYFINRSDCSVFAPGDRCDPTYGKLLREAVDKGVKVLPYRFEITPQGIRYLGLAEFLLKQP